MYGPPTPRRVFSPREKSLRRLTKGGQKPMPLMTVIMVLIVVGVLLWLVNLIPMQGTIKSILNAVVVIAVVLWLLNIFGLFSSFAQIRVGSSPHTSRRASRERSRYRIRTRATSHPRRRNPQRPHLAVQMAALQTQRLRRLRHVPAILFQ